MNSISIGYVVMALLGLVFGSFAGATVWRLRARQLVHDKANGEAIDARELKKLQSLTLSSLKNDRSRCLECKHELAWYDLLPLVSWLSNGGKCRYCKKPIGWFEPAIELGTAASFVAFYAYWVAVNGALSMLPLLGLWLMIIIMLVILFAYDAKWFILPDVVVFPLIGLSLVVASVQVVQSSNIGETLASLTASVAILGGLYLVLWTVSKGVWVGFGDVKLGLALGLLLGDWRLAFLALFLANLIGTLIVLPGLITKKLTRGTQVPFGPLLIAGFAIALLYGSNFMYLYEQASIWLASMPLMV